MRVPIIFYDVKRRKFISFSCIEELTKVVYFIKRLWYDSVYPIKIVNISLCKKQFHKQKRAMRQESQSNDCDSCPFVEDFLILHLWLFQMSINTQPLCVQFWPSSIILYVFEIFLGKTIRVLNMIAIISFFTSISHNLPLSSGPYGLIYWIGVKSGTSREINHTMEYELADINFHNSITLSIYAEGIRNGLYCVMKLNNSSSLHLSYYS